MSAVTLDGEGSISSESNLWVAISREDSPDASTSPHSYKSDSSNGSAIDSTNQCVLASQQPLTSKSQVCGDSYIVSQRTSTQLLTSPTCSSFCTEGEQPFFSSTQFDCVLISQRDNVDAFEEDDDQRPEDTNSSSTQFDCVLISQELASEKLRDRDERQFSGSAVCALSPCIILDDVATKKSLNDGYRVEPLRCYDKASIETTEKHNLSPLPPARKQPPQPLDSYWSTTNLQTKCQRLMISTSSVVSVASQTLFSQSQTENQILNSSSSSSRSKRGLLCLNNLKENSCQKNFPCLDQSAKRQCTTDDKSYTNLCCTDYSAEHHHSYLEVLTESECSRNMAMRHTICSLSPQKSASSVTSLKSVEFESGSPITSVHSLTELHPFFPLEFIKDLLKLLLPVSVCSQVFSMKFEAIAKAILEEMPSVSQQEKLSSIQRQLEYYFSDGNIQKDKYLQKLMDFNSLRQRKRYLSEDNNDAVPIRDTIMIINVHQQTANTLEVEKSLKALDILLNNVLSGESCLIYSLPSKRQKILRKLTRRLLMTKAVKKCLFKILAHSKKWSHHISDQHVVVPLLSKINGTLQPNQFLWVSIHALMHFNRIKRLKATPLELLAAAHSSPSLITRLEYKNFAANSSRNDALTTSACVVGELQIGRQWPKLEDLRLAKKYQLDRSLDLEVKVVFDNLPFNCNETHLNYLLQSQTGHLPVRIQIPRYAVSRASKGYAIIEASSVKTANLYVTMFNDQWPESWTPKEQIRLQNELRSCKKELISDLPAVVVANETHEGSQPLVLSCQEVPPSLHTASSRHEISSVSLDFKNDDVFDPLLDGSLRNSSAFSRKNQHLEINVSRWHLMRRNNRPLKVIALRSWMLMKGALKKLDACQFEEKEKKEVAGRSMASKKISVNVFFKCSSELLRNQIFLVIRHSVLPEFIKINSNNEVIVRVSDHKQAKRLQFDMQLCYNTSATIDCNHNK